MLSEEIEKRIFKIFDEKAENNDIVGQDLDDSHFELMEVFKFLGGPSDKKILDAGCGKGRFCRKIKDAGFKNVVGAEPAERILNIAREKNKDIIFYQASCTNLPFKDSEFDYVICIEVLEHIPDTKKALAEMARILKPGGEILIIDKNIFSLHQTRFVPTFLWKKYMEFKGRWMYPKNFPFKEKYFNPWGLKKLAKNYFSDIGLGFFQMFLFLRARKKEI